MDSQSTCSQSTVHLCTVPALSSYTWRLILPSMAAIPRSRSGVRARVSPSCSGMSCGTAKISSMLLPSRPSCSTPVKPQVVGASGEARRTGGPARRAAPAQPLGTAPTGIRPPVPAGLGDWLVAPVASQDDGRTPVITGAVLVPPALGSFGRCRPPLVAAGPWHPPGVLCSLSQPRLSRRS